MKTRKENAKGRLAQNGGFTLIEMIIAVTLVAMMAASLWSVFRLSINSWQRGTEFIDSNQSHRTILDLVKKQMASVYGLIVPVDLQTGGGLYPIFSGTESSVQFVSLNSLKFLENPGLTVVSYDVIRDQQGNYALVEREGQYLGLDPERENLMDRQGEEVTTIFQNLTSFMFEYFDPGDNTRPAQWVREWEARETRKLPTAVSMTMIARDPKGRVFSRHLVVPIMATPSDPRLTFQNPFDSQPRRFRADDPRSRR